ncbi:hypothetical protein C4D60_Mb04t29680 [Musa balbisiana]|uniref:Uncharacterized protein n=1 Tax=Musa balbisiana TaxID=52838 RepID=A0A4S8KFR1_MUSBA|nr:hypothetical protein C4D60_Mb04t29680 [Musa balbisiana]
MHLEFLGCITGFERHSTRLPLTTSAKWTWKPANLTFPVVYARLFCPHYIYPAPVSGAFVTGWLFGTEYLGKQQKPGAGLRNMTYADTRRRGGIVTLVCFSAMFWLLVSQSICSENREGSVSGCHITSSIGSKKCHGYYSPTTNANPPPTTTDPYKRGVNPPAH